MAFLALLRHPTMQIREPLCSREYVWFSVVFTLWWGLVLTCDKGHSFLIGPFHGKFSSFKGRYPWFVLFFFGSRSYPGDPSGCFLFMISSLVEKWGMRQLMCSLPLLLGTVKFMHQTADFTPASPVSVSTKPKHYPSRQLLCKGLPTSALTGASAPLMCDCWSNTEQLLSNSVSRF